MPVSDGLEFIREFGKLPEQQQKDTRLVLLSSSVFEKDRLELFDLPEQVVFMRKPLTREMLDRL
jgi:CheY-like chemotaxis protein